MWRLALQVYKRRTDILNLIHHAHKMKRNLYREMIESAKRRHWENFLRLSTTKLCGLHISMCPVSLQTAARCGSLP